MLTSQAAFRRRPRENAHFFYRRALAKFLRFIFREERSGALGPRERRAWRGAGVPAIQLMRNRLPWDIAAGRWLALCVHPICAWRVRSTVARAVVVTSYFAAGYVGVLAALEILNR